MLMDFDPAVTAVAAQPFWLHWHDGRRSRRSRRHAPDFFARLADGTGVVIDVRADDRVEPEDAEAFGVTAVACEAAGWEFRRVGTVDPVLAANVRWLSRYRHSRCAGRPGTADALRRAFAVPAPLLAGAAEAGDSLAVLPVLFHLIWRRADGRPGLGAAGSVEHGPARGGCPVTGLDERSRVRIGDQVRFRGTEHAVIGLAGTTVRLAGADGALTEATLGELASVPGFERVGARLPGPLPSASPLDGLPQAVVAEALWWERPLVEVLRGLPPDALPGAVPRPEYDPGLVSLTRREQAKAAELTAAGRPVTVSAVKQRRQRYESGGLAAMADRRAARRTPPYGRADPRVVEAVRQAISEATNASTRTASYVFWRAGQILEAGHGPGAVALPSRASLYRLFSSLSPGKHTTGSARTRRFAGRPPGRAVRRPAAECSR